MYILSKIDGPAGVEWSHLQYKHNFFPVVNKQTCADPHWQKWNITSVKGKK